MLRRCIPICRSRIHNVNSNHKRSLSIFKYFKSPSLDEIEARDIKNLETIRPISYGLSEITMPDHHPLKGIRMSIKETVGNFDSSANGLEVIIPN